MQLKQGTPFSPFLPAYLCCFMLSSPFPKRKTGISSAPYTVYLFFVLVLPDIFPPCSTALFGYRQVSFFPALHPLFLLSKFYCLHTSIFLYLICANIPQICLSRSVYGLLLYLCLAVLQVACTLLLIMLF